MQIVAVPLFNENTGVEAYIFRDLKENNLLFSTETLHPFDGATYPDSLRLLRQLGLDIFTLGKPIFVPIQEMALMGGLSDQCKEPPDKIIFVLEKPLSDRELYLPLMKPLREMGYRFAFNYPIQPVPHDPVLQEGSFIFLSQRSERAAESESTLAFVKQHYRNLTPIATHIYTRQIMEGLRGKGYQIYESRLYKPGERGEKISPLKINAIRLINTVQDENFDFDQVTQVVRGDPALSISLLKLVNSSTRLQNRISSIQQAVAMIGQREVRKWVATAVSRSLGSDRPNEITRISLIRAKFAENLAPLFEMAHMAGELFLLGLFSLIDIILEVPMADALQQVMVSENIQRALLDGKGIFYPILEFVADYENAAWSKVSRQMILNGIEDDVLSEAYLDSLQWYRDLVSMDGEEMEAREQAPGEQEK